MGCVSSKQFEQYEIEEIPYLKKGLDGFLSAHQLEIHVGKHHQMYVDNCNKLIPSSEFRERSIEEIIQKSSGAIYNNICQHYNHSFFWRCLSEEKQEIPDSVKKLLEENFESVDKFKEEFVQKASTVFGSGWCFLYKSKDGKVQIGQFSNADNPVKESGKPLLCIDTWEHAWYIDYENRKAEYFGNFWQYVNWKFVEQLLNQ